MKRGSVKNQRLDRYIGVPVLFAMSLFKRKHPRPSDLKRIGIMASPGIGDTLLNSAAVADLRAHFPGSRIIYIVPTTSDAAAHLLPYLDEIVRVNMTKPIVTLRAIRKCKLDAIIDFTPWPRLTALYCALSGASLKVGFRSAGQYRHWNYDVIADHSCKCHELENYRTLLRALGLNPVAEPAINLPSAVLRSSLDGGRQIVFHPWASGDRASFREWPQERWVELGSRLSDAETTILITGGPSDVDRCVQLQENLVVSGIRAETLCGRSDLRSVAVRLQTVDLVVSVNTGLMHLAAIVGAPTVSLNGPTATHRYGPVGPRVTSVEPEGGGGFLNFGFEFNGNPTDSMLRITVDDVVEGVRRVAPALVEAGVPAVVARRQGTAYRMTLREGVPSR
jgi:heptosyltransferase-3